MAAKKRPATKKAAKPGSAWDHSSYVQLRTVLDGLELGAIRHYLAGRTAAERRNRSDYLAELLRPIAKQLITGSAASMKTVMTSIGDGGDVIGGCPDGLRECNGVCVAYPCPDSGGL